MQAKHATIVSSFIASDESFLVPPTRRKMGRHRGRPSPISELIFLPPVAKVDGCPTSSSVRTVFAVSPILNRLRRRPPSNWPRQRPVCWEGNRTTPLLSSEETHGHPGKCLSQRSPQVWLYVGLMCFSPGLCQPRQLRT